MTILDRIKIALGIRSPSKEFMNPYTPEKQDPQQAGPCGGSMERTNVPMTYKLGSLFDGSGGFPLAGSMCGITPVWAAEVEPYPIAVTRSRFPNMRHLGDISKVNGAEIEPVDIITFGSPCQDLSVAGKRAGMKHADNGDEETTRSGLFMEAVRIIKEMREATNGIYPNFALWENVPGAFSSNKGEDFRTVLQELIQIVEPAAVMPAVPQRGWAYADSYCGDGWSLAYRVFDAQYWGVPQRRRRIHLVVDFTGQCARNVLFEREGVRGHFETGRTPWQGITAAPQDGTGTADIEGKTYGIVSKGNGEAWPIEEKHMALSCGGGQAGQGYPCAMVPYTLKIRSGCEGGQQINVRTDGKSPTLRVEMHGNVPCVMTAAAVFRKGTRPHSKEDPQTWESAEIANTLNTFDRGESRANELIVETAPVYSIQGNTIDRNARQNGSDICENVSHTINAVDRHGVAYGIGNGQANQSFSEEVVGALNCMHGQQAVAYGVDCRNATEYPEMTGTLQAKANGGFSLKCNQIVRTCYIVRRLTPTECARLQGFADNHGHIDKKNSLTPMEYRFWLDVRNTHARIQAAAVIEAAKRIIESEEAKSHPDPGAIKKQQEIIARAELRKEKDYTEAQMVAWHNKLHTDSAEYKMWGNGIALPPALYCMQGIVDALRNKK